MHPEHIVFSEPEGMVKVSTHRRDRDEKGTREVKNGWKVGRGIRKGDPPATLPYVRKLKDSWTSEGREDKY